MKRLKQFGVYLVLAVLLIYPLVKTVQSSKTKLPVFAFLIPEASQKLVSTHVWTQAALEEGVPMQTFFYEQILNAFQKDNLNFEVILIPDEVARYAPATLLSILQRYVEHGGKLVLVSDALSQEYNERLTEVFPLEKYFHFPKITGRVGDTITFRHDPIQATDEWMKNLKIPPGSDLPVDNGLKQICNYQSKQPPYPHWETEKVFDGTKILEASDGSLVAGIRKLGKGEVLWINLPLSYLAKRTDGLFLHTFLRWISEDWVGLPKLLPVPDGVGGMVLNIHVDSNAALPGLEIMKKIDMFSQGPFSIHITAGPDANTIGDHLGFNLPENKNSQDWVKYWVAHHHEVGSHGGWVHDYFGKNLPDHSDPEFLNFLELNKDWVGKISGKPVLEYSSPVGNHPVWISEWIAANGFNSYYFTGNNGLGPTRTFRDEVFTDQKLWTFPVASYLQVASFEEAQQQNVSQTEIQNWLIALSDYVVQNQTSRLFYFHPPGVKFYQTSLREWMKLNKILADSGRFAWHTMNQMATFLDAREKISWNLSREDSGAMKLSIANSPEITHMVWKFPKKSTQHITVQKGQGTIKESKASFEFQPTQAADVELIYEEVNP